MTYEEVKKSYQDIIKKESAKRSTLSKTIFQVGTIRLIIVIACLIACYALWSNTLLVVSVVVISSIIFMILMKYHGRLFKRRLYSEIQIRNAENELKGLDYDFSAFDGASEYINAEHSFSLDLDLFGERSFFQSINRTVTSFGKDALSKSLLNPQENKNDIYLYQEAIKELAEKPKLSAHFRTIGQMSEPDKLNIKDFSTTFSRKPYFSGNVFWNIMMLAVPALYVIWMILWLLNIIPADTFMYLWVLMIGISSLPTKKVRDILNIFDKRTATLDTYSQLLKIIEKEEFKSALLKDIQDKLKGEVMASEAIGKLKSLHNNLDLSFTFPILLIFNPILLWNVRYSVKIEKWMQMHKDDIQSWFSSIARFDSLISQSVFAYNHPDYSYPEIKDKFVFEGKSLGHPLINRDICVRNDVHIIKKPYFLVVTGANMAGKSTYLRTIGINHTLACAGMPVCAESLSFYPCKLVTNLRTADSLADNESYFFAELKRLKMIIDRLQANEELFIILDEILKGTNSEDKQKGSLALMRQLVTLNGNGIIATHDLVLGNLEKEYPDNVKDYCFEAEIKDDHLSFSYKMHEGIAQNMNACFLMKKMGITGL